MIFLVLLIALSYAGISQLKNTNEKASGERKNIKSIQFIQILIILASLLCLFPEFFYLRDQFGWRMNTIFKFYFQAWILFSIAGAFSIAEISFRVRKGYTKVFSYLFITLIMAIGLSYPFFAIPAKTNSFKSIEWTLDGNRYFEDSNPLENEAIAFLNNAPFGYITEAVGGSYSSYGRVSKFTGLPAILGWPGHELQWRGGAAEIGNRESDIKELYQTSNWDYVKPILDKYNIRYVFLGQLEKNTYIVSEEKFQDNLIQVFHNPEVTIYEYSPNIR